MGSALGAMSYAVHQNRQREAYRPSPIVISPPGGGESDEESDEGIPVCVVSPMGGWMCCAT